MAGDARGIRDLAEDLRRSMAGAVRFDGATRAAYATDASNFRVTPLGVVVPVDADDVAAAHAVCCAHRAPVVPRGAGTGLAGGAVNRAVVVDCSRLAAIGPVDPQARTVVVQPGAVNDAVQAAAAAHGLRFGPDPSSHATCTIGGNVAANACGAHSLQARFEGLGSRASDNLAALEVLTYEGKRVRVGPGSALGRPLEDLVRRYGPLIRQRFPEIPRRVSGYNLDDLLPGRSNLAAALAGTEGTCVTILAATLRLIPRHAAPALLVVGYAAEEAIATHLGPILAARPAACEWYGSTVLVELPGAPEAAALAAALRRADDPPAALTVVGDPAAAQALWQRRERSAAGSARLPGWEDSAVAPERVGDYLADLRALARAHHLAGTYYGHLGDGCVHARFGFDLSAPAGIARYRRFLEEAADLVVAYGGSLSGEHGDGQQRGELLERMFGPELVLAFREFKAVWDPLGGMNPGRVVDARPLDADLRT